MLTSLLLTEEQGQIKSLKTKHTSIFSTYKGYLGFTKLRVEMITGVADPMPSSLLDCICNLCYVNLTARHGGMNESLTLIL